MNHAAGKATMPDMESVLSKVVGEATATLQSLLKQQAAFDAIADPPGLWVINGTVGIHEGLRATLQSNDAADNGQSVDFDYMLEVM